MQVDSIKRTFEPPGTKHWKLKYDILLSISAFKFNLRRYTVGARACGGCPAGYKGSGETGCKKESACASNNGGCDALTACVDSGNGAGSTCGPCPAGFTGDGTSGCVDYDACAAAATPVGQCKLSLSNPR